MGISLKKIANAAGVSEATASLALNNRPGVNIDTKKRVQDIAKKMGYFPSANAQSLAKKKSGFIGVLVPNIANLLYSALVRGIEAILRKRGYKMILATTENNIDYEREMIEHFISFRVEGVIIYPMIQNNDDPAYLNLLKMNDIPLIFIGSYYKGIKASHVMSDIYGAICNAAEFLYHKGCRSFYYFGGCKSIVSNTLKIKALQDTLKDEGQDFQEDHYIELDQTNYECAYENARKLFASTKDVDAVITADAYTSLAVYNALIERGLKVPDDVSLISFDNLMLPEICATRLTCIEQNIDVITKDTIDELFEKIAGNDTDKDILIKTNLIIRDTTK